MPAIVSSEREIETWRHEKVAMTDAQRIGEIRQRIRQIR